MPHKQNTSAYQSMEFGERIKDVIDKGISALPKRSVPSSVREIRKAAATTLDAPRSHRQVAGAVLSIAADLEPYAPEISDITEQDPNNAIVPLVHRPVKGGQHIARIPTLPDNIF